MPSASRITFVECSGNSRDGWGHEKDATAQVLHGLTSTSEWTGVKLSTLLDAVQIQRDATWMLAEGSDAAALARSVPLTDEVLSEAMVCYGQNGEALRPGAGVSTAATPAGLRGQHQREMVETIEAGIGAVHDQVGDVKIYRSAS